MGLLFSRPSALLVEVQANSCKKVELDASRSTANLLQLIEALRSNTSVGELSLTTPRIALPTVTIALGGMLIANRGITRLKLSEIGGGADFASTLAVGLQQHTMLNDFCLNECNFGDAGFQSIFCALQYCSNLRKLELCNSAIGESGAVEELRNLLQSSRKLTQLNLYCFQLTPDSLAKLLIVLAGTTSLQQLNLKGNRLDEDCARLLCDVLRSHTTLKSLKVSFKRGLLLPLLDALKQHHALRSLSLKGFIEDARHIPDLLRAMSDLKEFELRIAEGALRQDLIDAIVEALQNHRSLLKFTLPDQTLSTANSLTIEQKLQENKQTAAAAPVLEAGLENVRLRPQAVNAEAPVDRPPVRRALPPMHRADRAPAAPNNAGAAAVPIISPEELQDLVRSLRDVQYQLAQLQPLRADYDRRQATLDALHVIQANVFAREYHAHVRLLLTCAHVGAAALRSGNVEGSGSGVATAGTLAVKQLPKLIAKGMGKAAASIPLLGVGASVLTVLIEGADARALNIKMQRVVLMASTSGELTAFVDCLGRRLTLLQWATVSSPAALAALVKGKGFRKWAVRKLKNAKATALYALKGEQLLTDAQKAALADVERFLAAVAEEDPGFSFDCQDAVGDEARAEVLTLRAVQKLLPGRVSYNEQLPLNAAAAPFVALNAGAAAFVPGQAEPRRPR